MLCADRTPVLLDFGSARQAMAGETQNLTSVVSHGYAPFEQYDAAGGEVQQGPWPDIYSFAATLYWVISGQLPPDAMTRGTALLKGTTAPIRPIGDSARGDYSLRTCQAIDKALKFGVEDRPASVAEWRELFPSATGRYPSRTS